MHADAPNVIVWTLALVESLTGSTYSHQCRMADVAKETEVDVSAALDEEIASIKSQSP